MATLNLFTDRETGIWVGGGGIGRIVERNKVFKRKTEQKPKTQTLRFWTKLLVQSDCKFNLEL